MVSKDLEEYEEDALSVGQLIEILKKYPEDMKVMTTWEGTIHSLMEENIYISWEDAVFFDADDNSYKKDFERNYKEII